MKTLKSVRHLTTKNNFVGEPAILNVLQGSGLGPDATKIVFIRKHDYKFTDHINSWKNKLKN